MAMAAEEAKMVEFEPEYPAELPPPPPPPTDVENKLPVYEENVTGEAKTVAVEEKPEPFDEKPAEGPVDRDVVLARVATEKKDALIKAWEESERSKIENRTEKKLAAIGAWENSKKAELEAELKKIEENLEKKKARYVEKMKNRVAILHKTAEEKKAHTEAKRAEDLLKAEEIAAKCRATGATPKKLLRWFSK